MRLGITVFPDTQRDQLPSVGAVTLSGRHVALRSLAGRGLLVVNVWASWCAECRGEAVALRTVAGRTRGRGVVFVGLDEQDEAGAARAFVARARTTYPQLFDPDGVILTKLRAIPNVAIPSTLIVDSRGRMAARIIGRASVEDLTAVLGSVREQR